MLHYHYYAWNSVAELNGPNRDRFAMPRHPFLPRTHKNTGISQVALPQWLDVLEPAPNHEPAAISRMSAISIIIQSQIFDGL